MFHIVQLVKKKNPGRGLEMRVGGTFAHSVTKSGLLFHFAD